MSKSKGEPSPKAHAPIKYLALVVRLQRSVREWAMQQGWGGRPVRQEQAMGILVAALGVLAMS